MKVPPNSADTERNILGVLMIEPKSVPEYINKLSKDFFYQPKNQVIFGAIQYLYDNMTAIDMITIANYLKQVNQLEQLGGIFELTKFTDNVYSSAHMEDWVFILQQHYLQRQGIQIGQELINDSYSSLDVDNILNSASNKILTTQTNVYKNTEKDMAHYLYELAKQRDEILANGQIGLNTGWDSLNSVISGWVAPDLVILAARPAQGKTAFMLNTILRQLQAGNGVGIFSLEMSGEQLVNRLLSLVTGIPHSNLRHNNLNGIENANIMTAMGKMEKFPLYIDDNPSLNIRDLRSKATIMKRKYDIKMLCVDYLQLMSGVDRKNNRESEIAEISRGCKIIAKELNIPVLALSQLSRAVESRADKMPQLSDLRESGGIEQDADSVIFLMRPETYGITEVEVGGQVIPSVGSAIVKIAKNRHGNLKNIPFRFIGEQMRFDEFKNNFEF